jgi:hypothetical protein
MNLNEIMRNISSLNTFIMGMTEEQLKAAYVLEKDGRNREHMLTRIEQRIRSVVGARVSDEIKGK